MKYTVEEIQKAYEESSSQIRQILDGDWVIEVSSIIGKELDLRIDKIDTLIRIIGLTLLNVVSIASFIKTLEMELEISTANATTIAKKVDKMIFQKVRDIVQSKGDENDIIKEKLTFEEQIDRKEITDLMQDIENKADNNTSFKDKFNKVIVKKSENRIVDPYRESID